MSNAKWKTKEILTKEAEDRFWSKVNKNGPMPDQKSVHYKGLDQCWQWTGATSCGYGRMKFLRVDDKAHRISKEIEIGRKLNSKEWVIHRCDNSRCVNPNHLRIGNHAENVADRNNRERTLKGEDHPSAKLTDSQIADIFNRYNSGERPCFLAREFNVTNSHICGIGKGRYRKNHEKPQMR